MIKAIVFDLGGVLFSEGKTLSIEKLATAYGYEKEAIKKILFSSKSADLRRGLISDEEFWQWARGELPPSYDCSLIQKEWYDSYVLDRDIFVLITHLKGKYRLIAFSGNVRSRVEFLEEKYRFRKLFDQEVYSFEHHVTKPEKRFIEILIAESGCRPEELVYIDDIEEYARPARELGITVLIYSRGGIERLRDELKGLGIGC